MRGLFKAGLVVIALVFLTASQSSSAAQGGLLVFEGRVVAVNSMPGVRVSCGVAAPQLLIQYEIEKVYTGAYNKQNIVIDHLVCGTSGVEELKPGDNVVVVAKSIRHVPEEIDSLGLRKASPSPSRYFMALSVGKRIFTMR